VSTVRDGGGPIGVRAPSRQRGRQVLHNRTGDTLHGTGHSWQGGDGDEASLLLRDWWDRTFRRG